MNKYVCRNCGAIFTSDSAHVERVTMCEEYWGRPLRWEEEYLHCPECDEEDMEDYWGDLEDGDNIADEEDENEEDEDND